MEKYKKKLKVLEISLKSVVKSIFKKRMAPDAGFV